MKNKLPFSFIMKGPPIHLETFSFEEQKRINDYYKELPRCELCGEITVCNKCLGIIPQENSPPNERENNVDDQTSN